MTIALFTLSFLLSFLIESGTEYIVGTPMSKIEKLKPYTWLLMYVSMGAGVGLSFYYQLDLIALLPTWLAELTKESAVYSPTPVGYILSGLAIGRRVKLSAPGNEQILPGQAGVILRGVGSISAGVH